MKISHKFDDFTHSLISHNFSQLLPKLYYFDYFQSLYQSQSKTVKTKEQKLKFEKKDIQETQNRNRKVVNFS